MVMKYSPSKKGFYLEAVHGAAMPTDCIALSDTQYAELILGIEAGRVVHVNDAGEIVLTDAPPAQPKENVLMQISVLEQSQALPRITRELLLAQFAYTAAQQGVDAMGNIAYAKLKAFDQQIAALRAQLV